MLKEILAVVKSTQGKVSNDKVKGRNNRNINEDDEESDGGDNHEDSSWKSSDGKEYYDILDPKRSGVELMEYCQYTLTRCLLPSYISKFPGGHTQKRDSSFTSNFLGLIIWKQMHGIAWV